MSNEYSARVLIKDKDVIAVTVMANVDGEKELEDG
jgi:hypothetical protein